mmetsp:Transcript_6783/g.10052  ORF Transcript_6783/g.10052 Transcript_6783/m.10052 type:complete len:233 (+) Transcript_6783:1793-2491(+)
MKSWREVSCHELVRRCLKFEYDCRNLKRIEKEEYIERRLKFANDDTWLLLKNAQNYSAPSAALLTALRPLVEEERYAREWINNVCPQNFFAKACASNIPWGPQRSMLIGISAVFYLIPALLDSNSARAYLWFTQATVCFWSDFLDSGRFALSHLIDKLLAASLTLYIISLALLYQGLVYVILLATPTFLCFGLSASRRNANDPLGYARFHALWHLTSSLSCAFTLHKLSVKY